MPRKLARRLFGLTTNAWNYLMGERPRRHRRAASTQLKLLALESREVPAMQFLMMSASITVTEGSDAYANLFFVPSEPPAGATPYTCNYTTVEGTARAGRDYTAKSGLVSFNTGVGDGLFIQIPILNNSVPQPSRTFTVRLSNPNNVTLTDTLVTIKILDDDTGLLSPIVTTVLPTTCPNVDYISDGTNRARDLIPPPATTYPVRYSDGVVTLASDDLSSNGFGVPWGVQRSWTNGAGYATHSDGGNGWLTNQMPHLVQQADGYDDTIIAVSTGETARFYDLIGGNYSGRFLDQTNLTHDTVNDVFTLIDGVGNTLTFFDFSSAYPADQRGRFKSYTTSAGETTEVVSSTVSGSPEEIQSSIILGGVTTTESYLYDYVASGVNAGKVESVTLRRKVGAGAWETVRSVEYTYYDGVEDNGNLGDLKTAIIKDAAGNPISTDYYRYYVSGEANGYLGGLKYVVKGSDYERAVAGLTDPQTATDVQLATYASNYFQYDVQQRVTQEVAQGAGCSACSAGMGTYQYSYTTSSHFDGMNSWKTKTVETLPDGSTNTVYTNAFGQVMLVAFEDVSTAQVWLTYSRYDDQGRLILAADSSAVTGFDDSYADLVHYQSENAAYLSDSAGRLTIHSYYDSTTATSSVAGGAAGYQSTTAIRNGELGNDLPQQSWTYLSHSAGGATVFQVAAETLYRNDNGTGAITTTYAYTYFSSSNAIESTTTTLPVVSAPQNGSGVASASTTYFDTKGRPIWAKDAAGVISYTAYDAASGGVVKFIADVDTDNTGDFAGLPSGWSSPSGMHLMTSYEVDRLGRTIKETNPDGMVTYTVYNDAAHEIRVYSAWNTTTDTPTGPTNVVREDWTGGYTEMLTMTAMPALDGSGRPTGNESLSDIQSLTRTYVNNAGQVVTQRDYFNLGGLSYSTGTMGNGTANFHETGYAYDNHGLPNKTVSPSGTIYRTEYDGLGRVVSEWVGTDDTPTTGFWSTTNLSGTNMVKVAEYEYDYGGVGDSLLTEATRFSGTLAAPDQVTQYAYDWRGRVVGSKSGVQVVEGTDVNRPITLYDYDNLNQTTRTRVYDGDGVALADGNGTLQVPSNSLLRAQNHASYDDLGRVYKTEIDNVNQANGTVGTYSLNSQTWYDERGLVRKQTSPGGPVSKSEYDSLGRLTIAYATDGQNDGNYTQALSVSDDVVLEQTEYVYDDADRVIQTISRQRFHDATGNGPLGNASSLQPKARVYNVGYFYDLAGRLTDTVNVGTNGNAAWTVPGSVPGRSDTVLVTSNSYGADGLVQDVTDARGIVTRSLYDAFGRTLQTVEDYGGANKTTLYTYGPAGMTSLTAVNASTGNQTTEWVFGVTTVGSGLNSNDVVGQTRHPDPATGSASGNQTDTVTVSALGQTLSTTDRNGTVHEFSYDAIGRLTRDTATTLGDGIDGVVRRQEFRYDTLGQVALATQYDATTSGNVTSQVQREYNGFGQLTVEYQAIGGAVNLGNTPKVQYGYSEAANGTNHSRLVSMTYPDGRELDYAYGSADGTDDRISRLTAITDASGTLEAYSYLGLATVVVRSHPQPGIDLSYVLRTPEAFGDAGDQYNGLDRFGRVVDQRWIDSGNGTAVDRLQYGYDANSNRLWRNNLNNATFGEIYAYDDLGQLIAFDRGTLDGNHTGLTGNATRSQSWDLDPLGNWDGVTSDGTTETREHNAQNEVVGVGNATLAFDTAGNMLTDEQGQHYAYDAWNRLVRVTDSGNATIAEYGYDALRRRTTETHGSATTELYYSLQWQVLEERDATSGNTTMEYTWSPVYVDAMIERDRDTDGNGSLDEQLWVQQDANWNVTLIADGSGVIVERYVYDAYGFRTVLDGEWEVLSGSSVEWAHEWQGRPLEEETGNVDFRYRITRPPLGRPIQSDLLGLKPDVNRYRFEFNNPITHTDWLGLAASSDSKPAPGPANSPILKPGNNKPTAIPSVFGPESQDATVGSTHDVPATTQSVNLGDGWSMTLSSDGQISIVTSIKPPPNLGVPANFMITIGQTLTPDSTPYLNALISLFYPYPKPQDGGSSKPYSGNAKPCDKK